ncbi:HalOD1 output domain-containing protein (plasmid) [Halorientalis pallida]|uniref:HalOD1 output domain-containing protein n=1 Tax=Halorientalis pallida TaxID=2479928 RepID=UPI003C6FDEE9
MINRNVSQRDQTAVSQPLSHGTQPYVVHHDFDGPAELTTTLAHAIADVTGFEVTETGFTLSDYVDPDALDRLFAPKSDGTPRTNGHLAFTIWNCQVTVYSTGQIVVTRTQPQPGHDQHAGRR